MSDTLRPRGQLLVSGDERLDPGVPGAPWWRYQRPPAAGLTEVADEADDTSSTPPPDEGVPTGPSARSSAATVERPPIPRVEPRTGAVPRRSGSSVVFVVPAALAALVFATRVLGVDHLGVVLFPALGMYVAVMCAQRWERLRPEEPWLPQLIVLGTIVKLVACFVRYISLSVLYNNVGDAYIYDHKARQLVRYWLGQRDTDPLNGVPIKASILIRWLTGATYYVFGRDLLAAYFLWGLLALIGSYFWYRAVTDVLPDVDKRLFLIVMLFVPNIVFWPASVGKEALMQVGVGALAWATSLVYRTLWVKAIPLAAGGGVLVYMIRPHLLAIVTLAAAIPYFVGKVRRRPGKSAASRPFLMVAVGLLVVFTFTAGIKFVGIQDLSVDSVEAQLDEQTAQTSYGGSSYSHGANTITDPLYLPRGFMTVVFRPFIWEAHGLLQLLAAAESMALIVFIFVRRRSVGLALRRWREPMILYCMSLLVFYAATFSALANFGLITRQRSLVMPALYALIALRPPGGKCVVEEDDARERALAQ